MPQEILNNFEDSANDVSVIKRVINFTFRAKSTIVWRQQTELSILERWLSHNTVEKKSLICGILILNNGNANEWPQEVLKRDKNQNFNFVSDLLEDAGVVNQENHPKLIIPRSEPVVSATNHTSN